jgi:hypothetical protein
MSRQIGFALVVEFVFNRDGVLQMAKWSWSDGAKSYPVKLDTVLALLRTCFPELRTRIEKSQQRGI